MDRVLEKFFFCGIKYLKIANITCFNQKKKK